MEWQDGCNVGDGQEYRFDAAGLDKSLRWWATETVNGHLILRRSALVRYSAVVVLVVGVFYMVFKGLPLMDPYIIGDAVKDIIFTLMMLSIPVIWAINVLRRRTVLSEDGIAMRRLVFTERRPWTSVLTRFTVSTLDVSSSASEGGIDRTRIVLVNGDYDDLIRLPGCVIGMTLVDSSKRGSAALSAVLKYVHRHGWVISDTDSLYSDPGLVEARRNYEADNMMHKARLVFYAPIWRRLKEHLCNGGLFLIGLGVLFLALGIYQMFFETTSMSGSDWIYVALLLMLGPASMAYPFYKIYGCFQRVVVDGRGIRAGRRSCPWPESRSGLFVAGDRIFVAHANGSHLALDGACVTWGSFSGGR